MGELTYLLSDVAARLSVLMEMEAFDGVRTALGKRVLEELNGPRRLRPLGCRGMGCGGGGGGMRFTRGGSLPPLGRLLGWCGRRLALRSMDIAAKISG